MSLLLRHLGLSAILNSNQPTQAETDIFNKSATSYFFEVDGSGNYTNSSPSRFVTFSGSSGTANVVINGVNYLATFSTNLRTTSDNFVTTHSSALSALGITVTAQGFASAGGITLIFNNGTVLSVSVTNVSGTLAGTVSNGEVSTAQRPSVVSGLISFNGSSYFAQPLSATRTIIIVCNIPNTASNFMWRGLNTANSQVAASVTGTGALSNISDLRYNERISEIDNNDRIDVGQWIVATYRSNSIIDRGQVFYGATNTGTSILSAGQYAAIMTFNFALTDREFQDAYNYIIKRINPKSLGLTTIQVPLLIENISSNALAPQDFPAVYGTTQDDYNQHIHPKVLDMEIEKGAGQTWGGYRYWQVNTPFPYLPPSFSNPDIYENPCIFASNDGNTWVTPSGVTNPLFPNAGNNGYNSDTHIAFDPATDTMYMYWREYNANADEQYFCESRSTDGWQTKTSKNILFTKSNVVADGANNYLSPVVFKDPYLNKWVSYAIRFLDQAAVNPRRNVISREIADTATGFIGDYIDCEMPEWYETGTSGDSGWHFDIVPDTRVNNGNGRGYTCVVSISTTGTASGLLKGMVLTSVDGNKWFAPRSFFLPPNLVPPATNWDGDRIYRPSLVKTTLGYDVWYSALGFPTINSQTQSRTGRTSLLI